MKHARTKLIHIKRIIKRTPVQTVRRVLKEKSAIEQPLEETVIDIFSTLGMAAAAIVSVVVLVVLLLRRSQEKEERIFRCARCGDRLPARLLDKNGNCATCAVAINEARAR